MSTVERICGRRRLSAWSRTDKVYVEDGIILGFYKYTGDKPGRFIAGIYY